MYSMFVRAMTGSVFVLATCAWAQQTNSCTSLTNFKATGVEITKAVAIAAGTTSRTRGVRVIARLCLRIAGWRA